MPVSLYVRRQQLPNFLPFRYTVLARDIWVHRPLFLAPSLLARMQNFFCPSPTLALKSVRHRTYLSALHHAAAFFVLCVALVRQFGLCPNSLPSLWLRLTCAQPDTLRRSKFGLQKPSPNSARHKLPVSFTLDDTQIQSSGLGVLQCNVPSANILRAGEKCKPTRSVQHRARPNSRTRAVNCHRS